VKFQGGVTIYMYGEKGIEKLMKSGYLAKINGGE
jgi:hypothetical protein